MLKYKFEIFNIIIKFLSFFINVIFNIILMLILLICSYAVYDSYQIYESVKIDIDSDTKDEIVINRLTENNKNIIGFINIYDTSINYPVLKGKDNIKYLNTNYKEEYSFSGSIFLDYRLNNFKDDFSIIYGHSLKTGGMFSDIKKYKDKDYFNSHLNGILFTEDSEYKLKVILFAQIKENDYIYDFNYLIDNKSIVNYLISKSINKTKISNNYDKLLLLSTCSSTSHNDRLILLTYLNNSL